MKRAVILVTDGFGIGHAPDAQKFGDVGANTFANIARTFNREKRRPLRLPHLSSLGLVAAGKKASGEEFPVETQAVSQGAYGYAAEISSGKDTPSGHWEMAGVPVLFEWGYFQNKQNSFSDSLLAKIYKVTGINGLLGNCQASGTTIIAELGEEHIRTGRPICYTSADSVFQVAAHEKAFGLERLYTYCQQVRQLLLDEDMNIGRVIARPFVGTQAKDFKRTGNRRDYSILPPAPTVLDKLKEKGGTVVSIGKIADIFAHQGISKKTKANGLPGLIDATLEHIKAEADNSLIFTNLVHFDQDYGHRRDPIGYGQALEYLDSRMPDIFAALGDDDLLFITSDHGCDPTWKGTDHTREYVPVLAYKRHMSAVDIGRRDTFADLGQTIAEFFDLEKMEYGKSFLKQIV